MINRDNWLDVQKHLDYRLRVQQNDKETVRAAWIGLRHLLEWADSVPFTKADTIRLPLPEYMLTARIGEGDRQLTPKYMSKCLEQSRQFFVWAKMALPGYRGVSELWIETLRVRRSKAAQSKLPIRSIWTLEDVLKVINTPNPNNGNLRFWRDKAATAFLFLSGARLGAFVTLSLDCVDVAQRRVLQLPDKGVHTKNSKAAMTFLLPIRSLLEVVKGWDDYVRANSGGDGRAAWYARLLPEGVGIDLSQTANESEGYQGRAKRYYHGLKCLCKAAGVDFKSPHKLRHGHGVYGVKHARNMAELKAISQNLMHANVGITDGIYGKLPTDDVFDLISTMVED